MILFGGCTCRTDAAPCKGDRLTSKSKSDSQIDPNRYVYHFLDRRDQPPVTVSCKMLSYLASPPSPWQPGTWNRHSPSLIPRKRVEV